MAENPPEANSGASAAARTQSWQFLNITEPGQSRKRHFKGLVKANAMRNFKKNQTIKRDEDFYEKWMFPKKEAGAVDTARRAPKALLISRKGANISDEDTDSKTVNTKTKKKDWKMALNMHPTNMLGAGMVDPFQTSPTGGRKGYYYLINHFIFTYAPAFLPKDDGLDQYPVNRLWASYCLTMPIIANGLLHLSAACVDSLYGRPLGVDALYYRGETIGLINAALQSPDITTDALEETIAGVLLIVATENISGDKNAIKLHMSGLQRLIDRRGGLESIKLGNGSLQMLLWQDIIACTTTNAPPIFPCCPSQSPSIIPESKILDLSQAFSIPTATLGISSSSHESSPYSTVPSLLYEIRHLTLVVESFRRTRGATDSEIIAFSAARNKLEYNLFAIPTPENHVFATDPDQYIYEVVRIAAIMYINYNLHEYDGVYRVSMRLNRKLRDVISAGEPSFEKTGAPNREIIMLWVLFMGGLISVNAPEKLWFARRIARLIERLELKSWNEVEECLMRALWIRRMNDSACEALWMAVMEYLPSDDHRHVEELK